MTSYSTLLRPVTILSGVIGIAQSLAWLILSILAVSSYFCAFNVKLYGTFSIMAYFIYFKGEDCPPSVKQTNSLPVVIIMFIYLVGCIFWFGTSVALLVQKNQHGKTGNATKAVWSVLAILVCVLDLALGILFGIDYGKDGNEISAILMGIAFRGFVLWLINALCAGYLIVCVLSEVQEIPSNNLPEDSREPIDGFSGRKTPQLNNNRFAWPDQQQQHPQPLTPVSPLTPVVQQLQHQQQHQQQQEQQYFPRSYDDRRPQQPPVAQKPAGYPASRQLGIPQPDYDNAGFEGRRGPSVPPKPFGGRPVLPQPDYDGQAHLPRAHVRSPPYARAREMY